MAQWEIRNKPGYDPAQTIEADRLAIDKDNSTVVKFVSGSANSIEAIVVLTPEMTITKKK